MTAIGFQPFEIEAGPRKVWGPSDENRLVGIAYDEACVGDFSGLTHLIRLDHRTEEQVLRELEAEVAVERTEPKRIEERRNGVPADYRHMS